MDHHLMTRSSAFDASAVWDVATGTVGVYYWTLRRAYRVLLSRGAIYVDPAGKQVLDEAITTKPYGFLVKPFRERDVLVMLDVAWYLHQHNQESVSRVYVHTGIGSDPLPGDGLSNIIGESPGFLEVLKNVGIVAPSETSVLILGESGTGKELIAQAIHHISSRRTKPLIVVNCAALPASLIEAELFGHEKGAFTGALKDKPGRFELADGGTLFLDEIGDLPLESQASLLRFLQERKVERLGGHGSTPVDVRIVSATHVDMQAAMVEGRFRADLYHRLCVLQIDEPPLRERGKDIELLARHMLDRFERDANRRLRGFAPDAIAAIHHYRWPGNVRELINRVRRAIVMAEGRLIGARDLELGEFAEGVPMSLAQAREVGERKAIEMTLLRNRGRVGEAARELGVSRVTLYRILSAYSMRNPEASRSLGLD